MKEEYRSLDKAKRRLGTALINRMGLLSKDIIDGVYEYKDESLAVEVDIKNRMLDTLASTLNLLRTNGVHVTDPVYIQNDNSFKHLAKEITEIMKNPDAVNESLANQRHNLILDNKLAEKLYARVNKYIEVDPFTTIFEK